MYIYTYIYGLGYQLFAAFFAFYQWVLPLLSRQNSRTVLLHYFLTSLGTPGSYCKIADPGYAMV